MNQSERDALRAKHQPDEDGYCKGCAARNFDGSTSVREFPCDAIKVLDAWEADKNEQAQFIDQLSREAMNQTVCDHAQVIRDDYSGWQYDYCPGCGDKL
jgi:hypothetical protein